jgi:hypothetical protein
VWSLRLATFVLFCASIPSLASAATLSLDPKKGSFGPGDMFVVTVRLSTEEGECINAATVAVDYPISLLKVTAISKGESLLTLWPDEPRADNEKGEVTFSGGIPGGYCGRVLGDPGKTDIVGKVVFTVLPLPAGAKEESIPLSFASSTQVLENDGFGTVARLSLSGTTLTRALTPSGVKNEWLDIVHADTTPPDEFIVTVHNDPNTLGGAYFIVFSTVDKQSGIDHYEVMEEDPARLGFVRGSDEHARFVTVKSPFILKDQTLRSVVTVRAIDNAGNMQRYILRPSSGAFSIAGGGDTETTAPGHEEIWWTIAVTLMMAIIAYAYWHHSKKTLLEHDTSTNDDNLPPQLP